MAPATAAPSALKNDFSGKAVLITGGTKGIGLATGLAFGRVGARVYLTHKWGSADEPSLAAQFAAVGAHPPVVLAADAAAEEDTRGVFEAVAERHDRLDVLVSNVSFAKVIQSFEDYRRRDFLRSMEYSAWPLVGYVQAAFRTFSKYPRYVIGTSCDGPDVYYPGYDFVAAAKKVTEVFCRYMARHFFEQDVRVNIVRSRPVSTDSLRATFGDEFESFLRKYGGDRYFIEPDEVASAILALCSGWMDAMTGEVIMLDRGVAFSDNLMALFERRDELGLD